LKKKNNVACHVILVYNPITMDEEILLKIEAVLTSIRPALRMDGGGIEFVSYDAEKGIVGVKMQGACVGCPMSEITLKMGVEAALRDAIPSITEVVSV
jgi:Fe-S cluster biogenesis protein NfuA